LSSAFTAARQVVNLAAINDPAESHQLLLSDTVRKLMSAVSRWSDMEGRLRSSPAAMGDQTKLFDSINNGAAAARAMIGHLYALSNQNSLAVAELELACPVLWEHQLSLKTLDSDVSTSYFLYNKSHKC
jgi:hypothetical protein